MRKITIGRLPENNFVIDNESVSRSHCQIVQRDNGAFYIADLNSKNGTYVNNQRISGQAPLLPGDIVTLGNFQLHWEQFFTQKAPKTVPQKTISFGRLPNNDVQIINEEVSRCHCRIEQHSNGSFTIEDLGSTNGTFVNGCLVKGKITLHLGDKVFLGDFLLPWLNYFETNPGKNTPTPPPTTQYTQTPPLPTAEQHIPSAAPQPAQKQPTRGNAENNDANTAPQPQHTTQIHKTNNTKRKHAHPTTKTGYDNKAMLTFVAGLISTAIATYLFFSYFVSFKGQVDSYVESQNNFFQLFALHLRGAMGTGGHWFGIIATMLFGGLAHLFNKAFGTKTNIISSAGIRLANIGLVAGLLFLPLAIFAKQISNI